MALPESGIKLVLEISEFQSAVDTATKEANKLDSLAPTVKVSASDSELDATVKKVDNLDSQSATVKVNTDDAEVEETQSILEKMGDNPIIVSIGVAGGAVAAVTGILGAVGVGGVIEYDNALAKIQGRTGQMIPQARELISDLYTSGWGESRDEIADVIIKANNLGIAQKDLSEVTRKAFEVSGASGEDVNEILRTMDTLVKNKLASSYTEAANIITTGFQEGANRGDDLLDTFNEYGSTFKELGITGQGALGLINSGLDAGIDNSDRIADAIRETGIRLGEIGTNADIAKAFAQLDGLSDIDLAANFDAFKAGEMSGDDFFEGFFQALADANAADPTKAQAISATLVGTISEDFGVDSIAALTPKWDATMGVLEGRSAKAGTDISNTLGNSIQGFLRTAEEAAIGFLSSDAVDLDGKIALLKKGLQDGLASLQSDGDLSNALTIALKPLGFDDEFAGLESVLGNFVIAILQAVSTLQSLDPNNWGAKAGTDATIVRLAEQQLGFDLQVGNPDEVAGEIQVAISRGVTPAAIADTIGTAVNELIAAGTPELAASLLAAVQQAQTDLNSNVQLTGSGSLMNTEPLLAAEDFQALGEKITEAQTAAAESADPIAEAAEGWNTLTGKVNDGQTPMTTYGAKITTVSNNAQTGTPKVDKFGSEVQQTGNAASDAIVPVSTYGSAVNDTAGSAAAASDSLALLNEKLNVIIATANGVAGAADALANAPKTNANDNKPTGGGYATGGIANGTFMTGESGREIISSDTSMAVLNNRTTEAIMAAIQGYIPGGSTMTTRGGNTNIVNNTNYVASLPIASALGYETAAQIRGM